MKSRSDVPWENGLIESASAHEPAFGIDGRSVLITDEVIPDPEKFLPRTDIESIIRSLRSFHICESHVRAASRIVCATRPESQHAPDVVKRYVGTGAAPEAAFHLVTAAKARAISKGRTQIEPADLEKGASVTLPHRIRPNSAARSAGVGLDLILDAAIAAGIGMISS